MKNQFQKYYFLLTAVLIVVLGHFSNQSYAVPLGSKSTQLNAFDLHSVQKPLEQNNFTRETNEFFHKDSVNYTFVDHLKGNISESEFEITTTLKFQEIEPLLKYNDLPRFISSAVADFHSRKSALILSEFSQFYTSLNNALYLKFRVIRL